LVKGGKMISKKMAKAINSQINREIYSSYLYSGMRAYAAFIGLKGIAQWFRVQSQEEMLHAEKLSNYLEEQGERVFLDDIEKPPQEYSSVKELFEETLKHEKLVTSLINKLVDLSVSEKDKATEIFLQWFVTEQVEEEANPSEILQKLALTGEKNGPALLMLDNILGARGK